MSAEWSQHSVGKQQLLRKEFSVSRTTTVDTVPAGEVSVAGASRPDPFIKRGTPQFMRVTLALFSAGLATFALLYCVQPILPVLVVR